MTRRAFFVVGSEGSGTYFLWNMLQAAGCHAKGWHNGIHVDYKFCDMPDLLTIRRSHYHNGQTPDLENVVNQLVRSDYRVHLLYIVRDAYATAQSKLARLPLGDETVLDDCMWSQRQAINFLAAFLMSDNPFVEFLSYTVVTYEALCLSPGFRKWLFEERLGLTNPVDFEIKFANNQYYKDNNA